jgi:lipopolysaccharide exporter
LAQYGIEGAAIAQAIGSVAVFLSSLYLMHRLLGVAFGEIWESCWRPLIACVLMVLSVGAIKWFLPISRDDLIDQLVLLAVAILIGFVAYSGSLLLLWTLCGRPVRSGESYILTYLGQSLSRRRSNAANASSIANE